MLRSERYIGRIIWNRSRWVRSAADSKRRKRVENPPSEWIVREGAAIIDEGLWARVKARQDTGYASPRAYPHYLLSGLLECGVCGRKMTITGAADTGMFAATGTPALAARTTSECLAAWRKN